MKPILSILIFLVISVSSSYSQTVSTLLPAGSVIDDDILVLPDRSLLLSAFVAGQTYRYSNGMSSIFADTLSTSNGLAYDSQGNVFICDYNTRRILKVDTTGKKTVFNNEITTPSGLIKMPNSDTLIATSAVRRRLFKIAPDGSSQEYFYDVKMDGPVGLAYDTANVLYVANFNQPTIYRVTPNDTLSLLCRLPGTTIGFIAHHNGWLYATLFNENQIYKVNISTGDYQLLAGDTAAGSVDGALVDARFDGPNGIALTPSGDTMYITDFNTKSLRMITGLNASLPSTLEVIDDGIKNITSFPNPANTSIEVTVANDDITMHILNLNGKIIKRYNLENGTTSVDITELAVGTYLQQFTNTNGEQYTQKLQIVR